MLVQDWVLYKSYNPSSVLVADGYFGTYVQDFNYTAKEFRAVGTQEQLDEAINGEWNLKIDEFYTYEPVSKEDFWHKEERREQYNKKIEENLKFYRKLYKENENKLLILRIK